MPTVLHPFTTGDASTIRADVVFLHGLDGHWTGTWQAEKSAFVWPAELALDQSDLAVWSVEYEAASSGWRGHGLPIADRAGNILDAFANHGLGERPLYFITHSMGGLIAKQLLRSAYDERSQFARYQRLVDNTRGIVFLSTPHGGADTAKWATYLSFVLRTTAATQEMTTNAAALRNLNLWYRNNSTLLQFKTKVYYETQATHGVPVVDEGSADPGIVGAELTAIDADHSTICKPRSVHDQVYAGTKRFVLDLLLADTTVAQTTGNPFGRAHDLTSSSSPSGPPGQVLYRVQGSAVGPFHAPVTINNYGAGELPPKREA